MSLFSQKKSISAGQALILGVLIAAVSFALTSFSCSTEPGSAHTAFADSTPAQHIPVDALSVVEALQQNFRSVSSSVLPSVVEIDVVQTQKVRQPVMQSPFDFFFGNPRGNEKDEEPQEREYKTQSMGSGFILRKIDHVYYVVTNYHVVEASQDVTVRLFDEREFKAKVIGGDQRKDIAVVSFETTDENIVVVPIGNSDSVQVGDIVFAIGNPLGYMSSVTQGIVSAIGRNGGPSANINDFIQTDAAINQGNSGGPLVNIYGEVVGINTWIASNSGASVGLGFAIPVNNIKRAVDEFISGGKLQYGWIGVSLADADKDTIAALGLKDKKGAFISQIFLGEPADKAGMLPGDFVTQLNGVPVKNSSQFVRDVGDIPVNDVAEFTVLRAGKELKLKLKITERNEEAVANYTKIWPGFRPLPITDELREQVKLDKTTKGVLVAGIQPHSAAAVMGLQNGDVVCAVNDKKIENLAEFFTAAASAAEKKEIWFDIVRDGHTVSTIRYKK